MIWELAFCSHNVSNTHTHTLIHKLSQSRTHKSPTGLRLIDHFSLIGSIKRFVVLNESQITQHYISELLSLLSLQLHKPTMTF